MADNNQDPGAFLKSMYDFQQMYMKNMTQMFESPKPAYDNSNSFENWWKQMSQSAPPGLMNTRQPFSDSSGMNDWFGNMGQQFQQWMNASEPRNPIFDSINENFKQQLTAPFGASMFTPPQNSLDPFNLSQNMNSQVVNLLQQLFVNEEKRQGEKLISSLQHYQTTMLEYNHMMAEVGIKSLDQLQQGLGDSDKVDFANIYENWMDISQNIYKEQFHTKDGTALAEQLKKAQDQLADDYELYRLALAKNFGLAPMSDIDELKLQVADLKQQLDDIQKKIR